MDVVGHPPRADHRHPHPLCCSRRWSLPPGSTGCSTLEARCRTPWKGLWPTRRDRLAQHHRGAGPGPAGAGLRGSLAGGAGEPIDVLDLLGPSSWIRSTWWRGRRTWCRSPAWAPAPSRDVARRLRRAPGVRVLGARCLLAADGRVPLLPAPDGPLRERHREYRRRTPPCWGRAGPHPGRGPARHGRSLRTPPGAGDVVGLEAGQASPGGALRRRRPELRRAHRRLRPALRPDRAGAARRTGYSLPDTQEAAAAPAAPGGLRPGRGHRPRSGRLPAHPHLRAHLEGLPPGAGRPGRAGQVAQVAVEGWTVTGLATPQALAGPSACPSTAPPS